MTEISIPRKSELRKLPTADAKSHIRRNKHLLRWIKDNCCCYRCGSRPPVKDLTFHHLTERRAGGKVISEMQTTSQMVKELLTGVFLCRPCHIVEHATTPQE